MASNPLQKFLASGDWAPRFDEHILQLGRKLGKKPLLPDLTLTTESDQSCSLTASCEGAEVEVQLWPEGAEHWDFDTSCTCDHAHNCPHAAAVLFLASKPNTFARLLRQEAEPAPSPEKDEIEIAPSPIDSQKYQPTLRLHLTPEPATGKVTRLLLQALRQPDRELWLVARPTISYGPHTIPLSSLPQEDTTFPRDLAFERRALEQLTSYGLTSIAAQPSFRFLLGLAQKQGSNNGLSSEGTAFFPEPYHTTPDLFWPWFRATAIPKLVDTNWEVEVESDFGHELYEISSSNLNASLTEIPGGWFTLSVGFDVEGQSLDLLPILLKLLEGDTLDQLATKSPNDRHLVNLPNGTALHVPVVRLKQILDHLSVVLDPDFPLHPLDAAALAEDFDIKTSSPSLNRLRKNLAAHREKNSQPAKQETPEGLQATLRPYQEIGYQWMATLAENDLHGILADDMGLGKTIQTITLLLATKAKHSQPLPTLVVAPTSVVPNWAAEVAKFAPSLTVLTLTGPKRARHYAHIQHADIVLTSFALLQRDGEKLKNHQFRYAILDEAQLIKNPQAKVSIAARKLRAHHRLCLSGTPVENNLTELWSLFHFLIPGLLGDLSAFRTRYQNPIEKEENEDRREALRNRLAPLILRRTKDEVAKDLPPKTLLVHPIELTTEQKDLYESVRVTMDKRVRDAIAERGLAQSQITILDALLKLRQICCHPELVRGPDNIANEEDQNDQTQKPPPSAKLAYLFELLEILFLEKRRILLFSQFTSMLALIENELKQRKISYLKLTGASQDRGGLVKQFQETEIPIFLISLKAGGTGLNLTAADTVIHYDPWWNPAAEAQATDRAYRIGQTKPVFVHKLLCSNTVEDRIHRLQQQKAELANSILGAASSGVPDAETLAQLLSPTDA